VEVIGAVDVRGPVAAVLAAGAGFAEGFAVAQFGGG
jgi:hypothetical protein